MSDKVPKWSVFQVDLKTSHLFAGEYGVPVTAVFRHDKKETRVYGFKRGALTYAIRFCPEIEGEWRWETFSDDPMLCQKGTFLCTPPTGYLHGFIRKDPEYPYHFIYDDGSHYFMLGTTYYQLPLVHKTNWQACIDGSSGAGINKVRFHVGTAPGFNAALEACIANKPIAIENNKSSSIDFHFSRSLEVYENLDEIVLYMQNRGIVADMIMITSVSRSLTALDEEHFRYIVNRYGAFTNVIWCLANEWNYHRPPEREYFNIMGRLVREYDPYSPRLLSVHQQTRIDFQFFDQDWPTHAILQLGVRNGQHVVEDEWGDAEANKTQYPNGDDWGSASILFNWNHNMPVVNDEYGYIGEPADKSVPMNNSEYQPLTREKHRRILWSIYASCGYGSAGDKRFYPDLGTRPYFGCKCADCQEYEDIRRLRDFFEEVEYWKLLPMNDLVKKDNRVYASSESGRQYLVYAADGGAISLEIVNGLYDLYHINLETGTKNKSTFFGDIFKMECEHGNDHVFYLKQRYQN